MSPPSATMPSHGPSRAADPPSLGWMLLLAAALFALALPIVGPLDDHHFAERTHTHEHIYLNGYPVAHGHALEDDLRHLHPGNGQTPYETAPGQAKGVLSLAPATASLMLAVMSVPYHNSPEAMRPPAPRARNANPLTRAADPTHQPDESAVPPPLPPPIA